MVQTVLPSNEYSPITQLTGAAVVVRQLDPAGHLVQDVLPAEEYSPLPQVIGLIAELKQLEPIGH